LRDNLHHATCGTRKLNHSSVHQVLQSKMDEVHYREFLQFCNAVKAYQPYYSNIVFTISQKLHLHRPPNHHFTRKIQHFFWQRPLRMHQNTPFQVKNSTFFLRSGLCPFPRTLHRWEEVLPLQSPPLPSFLNPPCVPQNSSQIFANESTQS